MGISATDLVEQSAGIYALPEIYHRLSRKLEDPHASNLQLADIIQLDSGLAASILKIVNSAFYGFPSAISTISQAISIIGRNELAELVLGRSVINVFSKLNIDPNHLHKHWIHSLYSGLLAKHIAKSMTACEQSPDSLFVAGLLHDIGKLVIWHALPEQSQKIWQHTEYMPLDTTAGEKEEIGFDHAEAGCELLTRWQLPPLLVTTTAFHHRPDSSDHYGQACQIVAMANIAAHFDELDDESFRILNGIVDSRSLNIDMQQLTDISEIARQQQNEMSGVFLGS